MDLQTAPMDNDTLGRLEALLEAKLKDQEERIVAKFAALEAKLSGLQVTCDTMAIKVNTVAELLLSPHAQKRLRYAFFA